MHEPITFCDCFRNVTVAYTTRHGGFSSGAYASFNLGLHVQDDAYAVIKNRAYVEEKIGFPVVYMNQVHSSKVVLVDKSCYIPPNDQKLAVDECKSPFLGVEADGIVTTDRGLGLAVLTADCLPLLLCSSQPYVVAAVHCGWRGIAGGIIENAVHLMEKYTSGEICAFIGPRIGPLSFEIGPEVKDTFISQFPDSAQAFQPKLDGKFLCSLPLLCQLVLRRFKINKVTDCGIDTMASYEDFYSYRKNHVTGRLATIVAID